MAKTVKFYNVAIYLNGEKTDNSFLKFVDKISLIKDRKNVVRKIEDTTSAIFPFHFTSNTNMRIIPFGKFRSNYKPFIGDIKTTALTPIKRDVVEIVTMLYDETYKTAVIEFNSHGLKEKGIEEYLSNFMEQTVNQIWEVKLTPIILTNKKNELNSSNQIRTIEIKLKLDKMTEKLVNMNSIVDEKSIIAFFDKFANDAKSEIQANVLKLEFGVGNSKKATLNIAGIKLIFDALNINNDCIESIKLKYRNNKNEKIDIIDLKNINSQLKATILEDSEDQNPASEQIGNAMVGIYSSYEGTILDSYVDYNMDVKKLGVYKFKEIPSDINKVEVRKSENDV